MKKIATILSLLSISSTVTRAGFLISLLSICIGVNSALASDFKNGCTPEFTRQALRDLGPIDLTLKRVINEDTQVIVVGEFHTFGAGGYGYHRLFKAIQNAGFKPDCLTLEIDQSVGQQIIDRTLSMKKINLRQFYKDMDFEFIPNAFPSSIYFANQEHLKVFAFDDRAELTIERRNIVMSDNIDRLFSSKTCRKIIHLGGLAHISVEGDKKLNIGTLIRKNISNVVTLGLAPTEDITFMSILHLPTPLRCEAGTPPLNNGVEFGLTTENLRSFSMGNATSTTVTKKILWEDLDAVMFLRPVN